MSPVTVNPQNIRDQIWRSVDPIIAGSGQDVLFNDRFADNPRLRGRELVLEDLQELPHVRSIWSQPMSPVDQILAASGVRPTIGVSVDGFLPVPTLVAGTHLVGHVPERIAHRYGPSARPRHRRHTAERPAPGPDRALAPLEIQGSSAHLADPSPPRGRQTDAVHQ